MNKSLTLSGFGIKNEETDNLDTHRADGVDLYRSAVYTDILYAEYRAVAL